MVGRLVEQQQVGGGEQGGRECHAHAPAAGELIDRARLLFGIEAEAGEDGGGAGGCGVGTYGAEALVDFRQAVRVGGLQLAQQRQPFRVAFQHGVEQRGASGRGGLLHLRHAGAGGEADLAAIEPEFARDGAQQRGLACTVAPDQADAPPGFHGEVGAVQQRAATHAQGEARNGQKAHGAFLQRPSAQTAGPSYRSRADAAPRLLLNPASSKARAPYLQDQHRCRPSAPSPSSSPMRPAVT